MSAPSISGISHPGGELAELLHDPSVNADQFSTKPQPIYLERFGAPCAFGRRPNLAYTNLGVSRQPNLPQKSSHVRALD
jgi:hypothetical protein